MDARRAGTLEWLRANRRSVAERYPKRRVAVYDDRVIGAHGRVDALTAGLEGDSVDRHRSP